MQPVALTTDFDSAEPGPWISQRLYIVLIEDRVVKIVRNRGVDTHPLDADEHQAGKRNTQQIERKHLTLRTRIKRLVLKTICFSRSTQMHDIVIGLFVNRYEFGLLV